MLQRNKFEVVLQKVTEVGVAAIAPVLTEHSVVREPPDARRTLRLTSILREATEQCGRGHVPALELALPAFDAALLHALPPSRER